MPRIIPDVLKNLFSKPATLKYPEEKREPPEDYRGRPEVNREKCISCGICARACPAWAIRYGEEGMPIINFGKCVQCGECAENCPGDAIEMTKEYELATLDKEELVTE